MIPKILQYPNELLRTVCDPVVDFEHARDIALQLRLAATQSWQGITCIGLAAPQIGHAKRVIIVKQGTQWITMVNPLIVDAKGEQSLNEGCVSFDWGRARKHRTRPAFVRVEYQDANGESLRRTAKGMHAAAICHEVEHLDGKMFFDMESAA